MQTRLSNILLYYRNTPHSVTKVAPSVALNNRIYVTVKERVTPNFVADVKTKKSPTKLPTFIVGEDVLVRDLRPGQKWLRGIVTEKLAENMYNVYMVDLGTSWRRHVQQMLPYKPYCTRPNLLPSSSKQHANIDSYNNSNVSHSALENNNNNLPVVNNETVPVTSFSSLLDDVRLTTSVESNMNDTPAVVVDEMPVDNQFSRAASEASSYPAQQPQTVDENLRPVRRSTRICKPPERYTP